MLLSRPMSNAHESDNYAPTAELYDHVALYGNRPDIDFYVDAAREAGGPVLEVGCGTGRVLIPTARAGVEITGIDLSARMLGVCRRRIAAEAQEVRSRIEVHQADMRNFNLSRTFRLATIPFRPFQHLTTVDEQLACLACIRRHLEQDGRLILDLFNPLLEALVNKPVGKELDEEVPFFTPDGRRVVRRHKLVASDRFNQVNRSELIYYVTHPDGREERIVHSFSMRYIFRFEAEHLLARAGFTVEHLYSGFDKRPYGATYPGELIFVAKKTQADLTPRGQQE
jgi:SAM-dependent methyltransferase